MLGKKKTSSRYSVETSRSTFINLSTGASNVPIKDLISSHQTVEAGVPLQSLLAKSHSPSTIGHVTSPKSPCKSLKSNYIMESRIMSAVCMSL